MTEPLATPIADDLEGNLNGLGRVGGCAIMQAAVGPAFADLRRISDRWLPLARQRYEAAAGSPSDRDRWHALLQGIAPGVTRTPADLALQAGRVRDLLRALKEPEVLISDIARRVTAIIAAPDGLSYGTLFTATAIAAQLGVTRTQAELALDDLVLSGRLERKGRGYSRPVPSDAQRLADRLLTMIRHGVLPPGEHLPNQRVLRRLLLTNGVSVTGAGLILTADGVISRGRKDRTPVVAPGIPVRPPAPVFAGPVGCLPDTEEIRGSIRQARTRWKARCPAQDAEHHYTLLCRAASHLLPPLQQRLDTLAGQGGSDPELRLTVAWTRETAVMAAPPDSGLRVWHLACFGAAVDTLLQLTQTPTTAAATRTPPHH